MDDKLGRSKHGVTIVNPERSQQIEQIYSSALKREPDQRPAFLSEACKNDHELLREVEALLSHPSQAPSNTSAWQETETWPARPSTAAASSQLAAGQRLGPYRIEAILGVGGMGQVYSAVDTRLGRKVAIKISAEQFSGRFEREARAISALNHPHICTLYDVGALPGGASYLVTELVEGETLRDWLKRAPAAERSVEVARQVLEALRAAHQAGIIHRDLKPANIMVRFDGYVKVLDFGLAKRILPSGLLPPEGSEGTATDLSLPGQIVGTVAYMSPDQIQGLETDPRSDLFAFGIILHEMLTGRHPWPRSSAVDTLHAILHDDPPPMETVLAPVVEKLLRKDRQDRYPSAAAVLEALASPPPPRTVFLEDGGDRSLGVTADAAPAVLPGGAPSSSHPLTSIAVLPFVFLSDVDQNNALSLGFADALITMLGNLEDVAVTPTSAILKFAGADPAQVCRNLEVRYVLQGNVQKLGAQWRVSIQVFDAATQKIAFSEKHDFKLENVFDVQDEIGRRVVESLQSRFSLAPPQSRNRYSSDPEAYGEFMAGLRDSYSGRRESVESAIQHLSSAVQLDPGFALAHATLSYMCTNMHFNFDPQRSWMEKAEYHCERALALDRTLPEGHLARSWILWSPERNFQHAEAIAALEQVLAAQPNFERAHNRMSAICWHIGRMKEARIAHELARRSNPKTKTQNLEYIDLYSGDFTRTEAAVEVWLREQPDGRVACSLSAQGALLSGDLELAGKRLAAALKQDPDEPLILSLQGLLHACRNQTGPALECVRKALDFPRSFGHIHHAYHQIARVYAVLGDTQKAMAWLERTVDTGFPCWSFFRIDPHFDNLRQESAFQRLVAGLEQKYTALKIERL
jgi:TolB-like protein